jgi:hypothetical protein
VKSESKSEKTEIIFATVRTASKVEEVSTKNINKELKKLRVELEMTL